MTGSEDTAVIARETGEVISIDNKKMGGKTL